MDKHDLEGALKTAQDWSRDLTARLGWHDQEKALLCFVAGLHGLRDSLPLDEAVSIGAALPILLRGFFYEGWHPGRRPAALKTREALLDRIHDSVHRDPGIDPEAVARAIFGLLAERLPPPTLEGTKAASPRPLRGFWPS